MLRPIQKGTIAHVPKLRVPLSNRPSADAPKPAPVEPPHGSGCTSDPVADAPAALAAQRYACNVEIAVGQAARVDLPVEAPLDLTAFLAGIGGALDP